MKVMTIVGTRPEIIRLSRVIARLDELVVDHVLVHTGQNYDRPAQRRLLRRPGVRSPDHFLDVYTSTRWAPPSGTC